MNTQIKELPPIGSYAWGKNGIARQVTAHKERSIQVSGLDMAIPIDVVQGWSKIPPTPLDDDEVTTFISMLKCASEGDRDGYEWMIENLTDEHWQQIRSIVPELLESIENAPGIKPGSIVVVAAAPFCEWASQEIARLTPAKGKTQPQAAWDERSLLEKRSNNMQWTAHEYEVKAVNGGMARIKAIGVDISMTVPIGCLVVL